jgi:hypothetical protein
VYKGKITLWVAVWDLFEVKTGKMKDSIEKRS